MTVPAELPARAEAEVVVLPDAESVSRTAAERIAVALRTGAAERGRADWATTGGSTPAAIYRELVGEPFRSSVPWRAVHLWWGDDRLVPRDHPLSNVKIADIELLGGARREEGAAISAPLGSAGRMTEAGVQIPVDQVHAMPVGDAIGEGRDADWAAARYAEELRASGISFVDGVPVFDVVLVGIGPDGHLLSVFPGSRAFDAPEIVLPIPAPEHVEPHVQRVTLTPRVLDVARSVLVVVHGGAKAEVLGRIFGEQQDPRRLPAQLALRHGAVWLLDEAAAARLPDRAAS